MKRIFCALLAAAVALFVTGCGQSTVCMAESALPYRITAIMPHDDGTYWTTVANGIRQAGEELENIDVQIQMPQLNYNVGQMTDLIRRATAAQVDAIVVQGNEDADYCAALREAQEAGIQVALVDTETDGIGAHLYVGTDNYQAGEMIGRELIAQANGRACNVAVISGSEGYSNLEQRLAGFQEVTAATGNIRLLTVQYDNYDSLTVLDIVKNLQDNHPEIDTVVCLEGTGGQTIGSHYTGEDCPFTRVLAFDDAEDCLKGLRSGSIQAIAAQQPSEMGYEVIQNLARRRETGISADEKDILYTDVKILTKATLNEEAAQ